MARKSNAAAKIVGLALIVAGAGVAYWGYQLSGSLSSQLTKAVSGAMPDEVMYRYVGGAICAVVGGFLFVKK
jgi:uncharacterized protein YjeT (DUF2065 family)